MTNAVMNLFYSTDVHRIVMHVHDLPPGRLTRTKATIEDFYKRGVLPNLARGRGRARAYCFEDLVQILFAMELHSFGLTAKAIKPLLQQYAASFLDDFMSGNQTRISVATGLGRHACLALETQEIANRATDAIRMQAMEVRNPQTSHENCGTENRRAAQ